MIKVRVASRAQVADQAAAEALEAASAFVPLSCEQGVCGASLTRVIDAPCCSRALSPRLTIDL